MTCRKRAEGVTKKCAKPLHTKMAVIYSRIRLAKSKTGVGKAQEGVTVNSRVAIPCGCVAVAVDVLRSKNRTP